MATIDDINNFASDKQANYPGTAQGQRVNQQEQTGGIAPEANASGTAAYTPGTFYRDFFSRNYGYHPETDEEKEAREKKEKRDMVLASIGNGLNAFHQAYANARGVKPMTDNVSMTGKVRDRYERLMKERQARDAQYANAYMNAARLDEASYQSGIKNALEARRQDRLDRETKIKEDKAQAYQQYQAAATSKNEEQAAYWRAKWQALEAGADERQAVEAAKAAAAQARANAANASAALSQARADALMRGSTETVEETDERGRTKKTTKEKGVKGRSSGRGGGSSGRGGGSSGRGGGSLLPGGGGGGSLLP